jgi:hypothetical protein
MLGLRMVAQRNRRHLMVRTAPAVEEYTPHDRKIPPRLIPPPAKRRSHAAKLKAVLQRAQRDVERERQTVGFTGRMEAPNDATAKA